MATVQILSATATELFLGPDDAPRQVVHVEVVRPEAGEPVDLSVQVRGPAVSTPEPATRELFPGDRRLQVEVGIVTDASVGSRLDAEVIVEDGAGTQQRRQLEVVVAEPGWRMFMINHFHYDPVWWNTQAAYTELWEKRPQERSWEPSFQQTGFTLVEAHLDMARRDADYRFVLAELDYLKPYWDVYPQERDFIRQLLREGRLELVGGTYNEANTNLTSAENTARNVIYGIGYQRDVMAGHPASAWQLDVFGHDPQFPGMMADAGLTSSSWARGPFHQWGPNMQRRSDELPLDWGEGGNLRMQFASEFEWVSPSGQGLLTSYMPNHYSAGWELDTAATLPEAEAIAYRLFTELKPVAATRNVLLPVGTDYTPPNRWVTDLARSWNTRYAWPKFLPATAKDFFDAVREERGRGEIGFSPQSRDMNPIYTGKDVSYIDTKQMQRDGENTLLAAERFATIAALLGARYPTEAIDKAWRQLVYGAHHDGITGSESDQVYLDLLGGWREAYELGRETLQRSLAVIADHIDTTGQGQPLVVFNPLSWSRTDVVTATVGFDHPGVHSVTLERDDGEPVAVCVEAERRHPDGSLAEVSLAFVAGDVPGVGHRTYRLRTGSEDDPAARWRPTDGTVISNERYLVEVDPGRGGAISRLYDKRVGKELLVDGGLGNELVAYEEYPQHPHFGEGPWHLTPNGHSDASGAGSASVSAHTSRVGQRLIVRGAFTGCRVTQEITLYEGVDRIDFRTHIDEFSEQDVLLRTRFQVDIEGGLPLSEVGNAVIGRGFGLPDVDVADVPYTLDNPAYNWFGIGSTARVALHDDDGAERAARAIAVAEVVVPDRVTATSEVTRNLVVALARAGVTTTVSEAAGSRYGSIDMDSNLPDVRILIGGPEDNELVAAALDVADPGYAKGLDRQLAERGRAVVWLPAQQPLAEVWQGNPDLRGIEQLPILVVAGTDGPATAEAVGEIVEDLADHVIGVRQPSDLDGDTGVVEPYGVALLNRGIPGFCVTSDGALHLSLLRSCSGWPSGVWIDPPRRTVPDGSNFQFQHWSHTFEYALYGYDGDWRRGEVVRAGHDFNAPMEVMVTDVHEGELPSAASLVSLEPANAVLVALKPAGNPLARMANAEQDPAEGIVVRAYEAHGEACRAQLRLFTPLREGFTTNLLEEDRAPAETAEGALHVDLPACGIVTVGAVPDALPSRLADDRWVELGPRSEPAQPVYADYWQHNKGPAPMGYQPVTVQIVPTALAAGGAVAIPVHVASERTDAPVAGRVVVVPPDGWAADPPERLYRLAPGEYAEFETVLTPPREAAPGRYFAAARITDDAGQQHEDVVTIDYDPAGVIETPQPSSILVIDRITRKAAIFPHRGETEGSAAADLTVKLLTQELRLSPGGSGYLEVECRNTTAGEIRGEAQVMSPYETWPAVTPWTQGLAVPAQDTTVLRFDVDVPVHARPATYWALVKVMYFGRRWYTTSIPLVIDHQVTATG